MNKTEAIEKVIAIAKNEIGYLEKRSCCDLYEKTANAGSGNYTKYWAEIKPEWQGEPWCACFVTWVFKQAFGAEKTKMLLRHYPYLYCPTMRNLFNLKSYPLKGDIVIFYSKGEFAHTGIVTSATNGSFSTIEGNTSGGSSIIPNGGGVCAKNYSLSQVTGSKFITVDWDLVAEEDTNTYKSFLNKLVNKHYITDTQAWSNFETDLTTGNCVALFDKATGGIWASEEADKNIHWAHPHIISLCGKGYISDKTKWIEDINGCPSKAMILALVAKHVNNGGEELSKYENISNDHWGRNYLNYLCDKNIINSPSVWCDDFESTVIVGNYIALICKAFNL